jgi:hypothetical protein
METLPPVYPPHLRGREGMRAVGPGDPALVRAPWVMRTDPWSVLDRYAGLGAGSGQGWAKPSELQRAALEAGPGSGATLWAAAIRDSRYKAISGPEESCRVSRDLPPTRKHALASVSFGAIRPGRDARDADQEAPFPSLNSLPGANAAVSASKTLGEKMLGNESRPVVVMAAVLGLMVGGVGLLGQTPRPVRQAGRLASAPSEAQVAEAYGRLPLSFEANVGQADPRVEPTEVATTSSSPPPRRS